MPQKVAIIGAGPAGSYTAFLLARSGYDTTIYEEHLEPGLPIQCTGILTADLKKYIDLSEEYIVNRMQAVEVFSPAGYIFTVKNDDIIVCRRKFDNFILKKAISAGAKIETCCKFIGYDKEKKKVIVNKLSNNKKKKCFYEADILIGADGPNSRVSKIINEQVLKKYPTTMYFGAQATVKGNFQANTYQVYLGTVCPKFFAWVVPENECYARVGLATKESPNKYFNAFMEKLGYFENDITAMQGGLIPCYNQHISVQKGDIYLIGDAATIIKSTTGGGIIPHLEAGLTLVQCIKQNKDFNKELKRKRLMLHLFMRRFLDQFSDEEYDDLIKTLCASTAGSVMGSYTRDNSIQLIAHLFFENPKLLWFALKHVKKIAHALPV